MKYAIVLKAEKAQDLNIPGVTVLERKEMEDSTVVFIVDSEHEDTDWPDVDWFDNIPDLIEIEPL